MPTGHDITIWPKLGEVNQIQELAFGLWQLRFNHRLVAKDVCAIKPIPKRPIMAPAGEE
jgi:hypothetical protein